MHPIDANHDAEHLWTTNYYPAFIPAPIRDVSVVDYVINDDGTKLSGSDGSFNKISEDRASAYCVQVGG